MSRPKKKRWSSLRSCATRFRFSKSDCNFTRPKAPKLGVEAGIDGVVASPHEIKKLRAEIGDKIKIAVQGIRPSWAEPGDQKRFMTPREALGAGADYIGIGRPITAHPQPSEAVAKILQELS